MRNAPVIAKAIIEHPVEFFLSAGLILLAIAIFGLFCAWDARRWLRQKYGNEDIDFDLVEEERRQTIERLRFRSEAAIVDARKEIRTDGNR